MRPLEDRATVSRLVSFAILAAAIATLLAGYRFGYGHFIDFHPIVRGLMDPDYLPADFYTSVGREFGPRLYFAWIFAALAPRPEDLPLIYFLITLLVNIGIAALTGFLARDIFRSNLAGMFAAGTVMSASFFSLGGTSHMFAAQLSANRMALPFAIAAIWSAARHRPLLVGGTTGVATLLHPLFGLEVGLLLLASMVVAVFITQRSLRQRVAGLAGIAGGAGVLAVFSLAIFIPYRGSTRIPDETLVDIVVLRLAHEVIPSEFGFEWVNFALFVLGAGAAWTWVRSRTRDSDEGRVVLTVFALAILVTLAGGFVLTALFPTRLGVIASPSHRLAFLIGGLGLIAISGHAAKQTRESGPGVGAFLYSTTISPISVGLGHLIFWFRSRYAATVAGERPPVGFLWVLLAGLSLLVGLALTTSVRHIGLFVVVASLGTWLLLVRNKILAYLVPAVFTSLLAVALIGWQAIGGGPQPVDEVGPEIFPSHLDGPLVDIARRSKLITPPDSIFVTPPAFGAFRIVAERAIIADFKAFPYQEPAILEWRSRMFDQYGTPAAAGFAAEKEFDVSYRNITDFRLTSLCRSYGATHAILYRETDSDRSVLAENEVFSLVVLDEC